MTENPMVELVGVELSAVTFVRDYLQLHFDGPVLTAIEMPLVNARGRVWSSGDPGYRDSVCSAIGSCVTSVDVCGSELIRIVFDSGAVFEISIGSRLDGGEMATYRSESGVLTVW